MLQRYTKQERQDVLHGSCGPRARKRRQIKHLQTADTTPSMNVRTSCVATVGPGRLTRQINNLQTADSVRQQWLRSVSTKCNR
jgi:hypothetical protein